MVTMPSHDLTKAVTFANTFDRKRPSSCVVWDLAGQKKLAELDVEATTGQAPVAAISPSGERIVIAAYVQHVMPPTPMPSVMTVTGWDLKTGKKLGQVEDKTANGQLQIAALSESTAIISNANGKLRLFDFETGKPGDELEATSPGYEQNGPIVLSPDRNRFAVAVTVGNRRHTACGLSLAVQEGHSTFTGHLGPVSAIAFSEDGATLASGSNDSSVLVWDLSGIEKE